MNKHLILIVGASGTVGSELAQILKTKGLQVRKASSKIVPANQSDTVHLNLVTGEGLRDAFEGVTQAFFLSPPGYVDQYAILSPLIQESKRRGLSKVVLMTALGANAVETSPFRRAEIELEKSGLSYNILRPNWFLQNFNTFWLHGIREQNAIQLSAGSAKVSFIDARDISAVAARLLTTDDKANMAFDLTGPRSLDHNEVARAISSVCGRTITYSDIPPEQLKSKLLGAGLPSDYVEFFMMIMGFLREGYNAGVNDQVANLLQRQPRDLNEYVQDYKSMWK